MVVLVFMTSYHVSLNPNNGPVTTQTTMMSTAATKATGCPVVREVHLAKRLNGEPRYSIDLLTLPVVTWSSLLCHFLSISDLSSGGSCWAQTFLSFGR